MKGDEKIPNLFLFSQRLFWSGSTINIPLSILLYRYQQSSTVLSTMFWFNDSGL